MSGLEGKRYSVQLGGIDDRVVPEKDSARLIQDLQWSPEGYWEPTWGAVEVSAFTAGSGPISAIHWFQPRPNQRWLIVERRIDQTTSRISHVDFPDGTPTTILDRRRLDSSDLGTQFLDQGRWCWMLSPVDGLVRWNGERVVPVGFASAAPAPEVQAPGLSSSLTDVAGFNFGSPSINDRTQRGVGEFPASGAERWVYAYAATLLNDLGQESPPSPLTVVSGANDTTFGRHFAILHYPRSEDHIRGVRIWRSRNLIGVPNPDAGVALYLHSEWATAGEFDLLDLTDDTELTSEILDRDALGPVPIGVRVISAWSDATWLGGSSEFPHRLFYSTAGFPEQFGGLSYLDIGTAETGPIVALHPAQRGLLVFKSGGVFMVKGNHAQGFRWDEVDTSKGCAAPRAIETIPKVGVAFLDAAAGPCAVIGSLDDDQPTRVEPIGAGIRKLWRMRAGSLLSQAVSIYDPSRDEVWWQLPEGGNARATLGLVLHVGASAWSVRTGWSIGCFDFYKGSLWMGSNDDDDAPGVWLLTGGRRTRMDGTAIEGVYTTNPLRIDGSGWRFLWVEGIGLAMGRVGWEVAVRSDRGETVVQADTAPRQLVQEDRVVWGLARWDTGTWSDYDVAVMPVSVDVPIGFEHAVRLSSQRMRLTSINLVLPPGKDLPKPRPEERR